MAKKQSKQSKGGKARAKKMSKEERSEVARKAAKARWAKKRAEEENETPQAVYGSPNRPLRIGDIELQCYVLGDGRRVLSHLSVQVAIGMSKGGGSGEGQRITKFLESIERKGVDTNGLATRSKARISFVSPYGGNPTGYEATLLPEICEAVLTARRDGVLQHQQMHFADRCEILLGGLARVGIIAFVDEATGYQEARAHDALAKIMEAFVADGLRKWVKTFPPAFYREMYRLWGWKYPGDNVSQRTPQAGVFTNDWVYDRLAPGVLEELRRLTPRDSKGRLKTHPHRRLTRDIGHPALREHLARVVTMMQMSETKEQFLDSIDRLCPKFGITMRLPFDEVKEDEK